MTVDQLITAGYGWAFAAVPVIRWHRHQRARRLAAADAAERVELSRWLTLMWRAAEEQQRDPRLAAAVRRYWHHTGQHGRQHGGRHRFRPA